MTNRTFAFAAWLAAFAAISNAASMSREEAMFEASRLAEYEVGFATVVPVYLERAVPGNDAECKAVSRMFRETCNAYACSDLDHRVPDRSIDHLAHQIAMLCCHHSCGPTTATAFDTKEANANAAAGMSGHTDLSCRWTAVESCEQASWDLKRELAGTEGGDCCDTCTFPTRDPTGELSDAYRASCTADRYQGHAVCGGLPNDAEHDDLTPNADVYIKGGCSAGPEITLNSLDEDCHWDDAKQAEVCNGRRCEAKYSDYGMDSFLKAMAASAADGDNVNRWDAIEDLSGAGRAIFEGLFGLATRAYVVNDHAKQAAHPADFNPATVTVSPAKNDDDGNQCFQSMVEPYTESKIHITSGQTWMYNPTATKDARITVSGPASVGIVGGNNAGAINVYNSTGRVQLAGITNSGPVSVDGASNVFISGVVNNAGGMLNILNIAGATIYGTTNHANIVVGGSKFDAYQIDNTGSIFIKDGAFNLEFCSNTGSVVIERCDGVCTVSAPEGTKLRYPSSVKFVAYTGLPCGETAVPSAPPLPRPPPAAFQCIEERCDDEHTTCTLTPGCSGLYELLKREDRAPTDEEVAALEGDGLAAFHGVNVCYKGKCEDMTAGECVDPAHNCQCTGAKVAEGHCGGAPGCYTATTEEECRGHHDIWLGNTEPVIRGETAVPSAPAVTGECVDPAHNCQCTGAKVAEGHCGGAPGCYTATTEEECRGHHDIWLGNTELVIRGRVAHPEERDAVLESVVQSLGAAVEALQSLFSYKPERSPAVTGECVDPAHNCQCSAWKVAQGYCGGALGCYTASTAEECQGHADFWRGSKQMSIDPPVEPGTGGPAMVPPGHVEPGTGRPV